MNRSGKARTILAKQLSYPPTAFGCASRRDDRIIALKRSTKPLQQPLAHSAPQPGESGRRISRDAPILWDRIPRLLCLSSWVLLLSDGYLVPKTEHQQNVKLR